MASIGGAECAESGGTYQGDDTSCAGSPCGACCLPDQTCELRGEEACLAAGGSYLGDGAICNIDCTRGACCLVDGSCMFLPPTTCEILNGQYRGDGISCESITCP